MRTHANTSTQKPSASIDNAIIRFEAHGTDSYCMRHAPHVHPRTKHLLGERVIARVEGGSTDQGVGKFDFEALHLRHLETNFLGRFKNLRPDAVARQIRDLVRVLAGHHHLQRACGRRAGAAQRRRAEEGREGRYSRDQRQGKNGPVRKGMQTGVALVSDLHTGCASRDAHVPAHETESCWAQNARKPAPEPPNIAHEPDFYTIPIPGHIARRVDAQPAHCVLRDCTERRPRRRISESHRSRSVRAQASSVFPRGQWQQRLGHITCQTMLAASSSTER